MIEILKNVIFMLIGFGAGTVMMFVGVKGALEKAKEILEQRSKELEAELKELETKDQP